MDNYLYKPTQNKHEWRDSKFDTFGEECANRVKVKRPRPTNRYSDTFKAMALLFLRCSPPVNKHRRVARLLNIPKSTLLDWDKGRWVSQGVLDFVDMKSEEFAKRLDELAQMIAETLPNKIDKASLKDSVLSISMLVDKSRLLRGEATSITQRQSDGTGLLDKIRRMTPQLIETEVVQEPEYIPVVQTEPEEESEQ